MAASRVHDASLEREDLLQPVTHVIDAHNLLVRQLQEVNARQDCAAGESAQTVERLRSLEEQFGERFRIISDDLRNEIRDAWNSADETRERDIDQLRTILKAAGAERQEVRKAQGTLDTRLTTLDKRLANLDASFHELGTQMQEQSSQFRAELDDQRLRHESLLVQQKADHRLIVEESLPALRSDLFSCLEQASSQQGSKINKMEKHVSTHRRELDKAEHERKNMMARFGPLEVRVGKAETMCAEAGQDITKEIMQLEAQINAAKEALCDHMKTVSDDYRKAGQDEAADVLNKVGAECRRIGILEKTVATLSEELERRLSNIIGQHHGLAEHVAKDFDIARSEIATGRAQLQMLEATAHDLKVDMQSCTQQANRDRDEFTAQLSEFGAQHRQISSCLARCEPLFNQVEDAMKSAVADREKLRENPEFAASVTHCLSCGQNRNLCPWPCSPFILDKDALTPGTDPDDTKNTAKRPESYGFRPMRSRPTSAGKFSQSCETRSTTSTSSGIVPAAAGAAHVICRVAGGPGTPRPQSSHRYRAAKSTPVVDRAL
mmetsp:Transcript_101265/g.195903  ORF Transcript_101265/g.195903 Transcript_101265/m.195903 type:complete len:550 (-) Transcript_101265:73-1722(-)